MMPSTSLQDLIGIEHSKLGFFQELRQKIEELKQANAQSEERRHEIGAILDGITDVMMVLSEDLRIISVNHVFEEVFPGQSATGHFCYELFRNATRPCPECPAFRSLATDSVCRDTAIFRINGRNRQFEMVASPLKNPNWPQHRVLIFKRDVTMEKVYQAKFYQAEKMATIGVMAAGVAHEINNPLAAVAGFTEGIQRRLPRIAAALPQDMGSVSEDLKDYTETILKECRRCQEIVQTLLTFSRPVGSTLAPTCLNQVVQDTLRLLRTHLRGRPDLEVVPELAADLPLIQADGAQLRQVVLNLMTNALDATDGQGRITVRTTADGDQLVQLDVRDTGCGIPKENLDKLFEPFFTTKPAGKGIGIGLSTCYAIVGAHQGDISVVSHRGQGSTFTVRLPLNQP